MSDWGVGYLLGMASGLAIGFLLAEDKNHGLN